ncbi:LamG-like jellyroll fold domain-containing protein [Kitasatospora sp. NPDC057692]|uniref:LamG-like jellyroll fold domain-containing protein n=1 Tax=Kitasatospora sp. NPDC057692 TaxID=3346215 RepID=UPI00367807C4
MNGEQVAAPDLSGRRGAGREASAKSQGEAASRQASPTKESSTDWTAPADPAAGAVEVTAQRTPTTSVFENPDGTKTMRVYSRPVHYRKADGTWADIDTGLSRRRDNRWTEAANDQALSFAPGADSPALLEWALDSTHRLSYSLQGAKPVAAVARADTLTYPGALPDADVVYNTLAAGIKESLVLHTGSAPMSWVFPLSVTGLSPALDASGNVRFTDEAGQVRMTIPHGFMEDSAVDPSSGEPAHSDGVTYRLTDIGGKPALVMDLDAEWLKDPRRVFPVKVDPTGQTGATRSTYVDSSNSYNHASEDTLKVGSYNGAASSDISYLVFDSLGSNLGNMYVQKAELNLNAIWSGGCLQREVAVHAITSAWSPSGVTNASQVPFDPAAIASASFKAPNSNYCPGSPVTVPFNLGDSPTAAGVQLVNGWTHGAANYGFALTSDIHDIQAWKKFDSVNTNYPPFLKLTYVDWAASYSVPPAYTPPTYNSPGSQQVTMTNLAANWWNSDSMRVRPRFYDANWNEQWPGAATTTGVPWLVKSGESVTFDAVIPPMAPGQRYQLCWDGLVNGTYSLLDNFGIPYQNCTWVEAVNVDPQLDVMAPLSNAIVGVLQPQLYATGHDPDNFPGYGLDYDFRVYTNPSSGSPELITESGWQPNTSWAVPAGLLDWGKSYLWNAKVGDHRGESWLSNTASFSTEVQQPLITSHLGGAAGDASGRTFDPKVGNYTTEATDAEVKTVGPALTVTRSYNSLDPRTSTLFGAGWTTAFDMRVQPDADGTGSVVLTTASGRAARFGADPRGGNVFTPPPGEFESLSTAPGGGFDLMVKGGTRYEFHTPSGGGYALSSVTDANGHRQSLDYTNGRLGTVTDTASNRSLHFEWTADGRHVARVYTDPAYGTDWNTALTWTYTYNASSPDELDQVCTPPAGANTARPCTTYTYSRGSHLKSAVLDSAPVSYWRLGERSGGTAASEVIENQGNDNARYSASGVTLGTPGPTASTATAATFDGSSGYVSLPQSVLDTSSYTSVGLWFKTSSWGVLFSYQADSFPGNGTTPAMYTPALYVGASGKLHAKFWNGPSNTIDSAAVVNDDKWHFALLSAAGTSQTLYLDGQPQGSLPGAVIAPGQRSEAVGGGFISGWWPDTPYDHTGHANYFAGSISDVAFYNRALGAPTVTALWEAGSQAAPELSGLKLPSGKNRLTVAYDTLNDRAQQVTDENGGTWKLDPPTTAGSSQEYRGQVMGSRPTGYWRLSESAGVQAANQVYTARPTPNNGSYSEVALGGTGPFPGTSGAATFNGSTSWAELPAAYAPPAGPGALGLWFRTTGSGVLLSYQSFQIGGHSNGTTDRWNPALYVGNDGRLRAQLWMGDAGQTMVTQGPVNDGNWHFAVLSADSPDTQTLFLDGAQAAGPLNGTITPNGSGHVFLGAGAVFGGWPAPTTDSAGHFKGQIANVAAFPHGFDGARVAALYRTAVDSGLAQYDAAVLDAHPTGYWRLDDKAGNQASEVVSSAALAQNRGTNHNTTCCQNGPWASGESAATGFDGTTSYVQLPGNIAPKPYGATTVELWFRTTKPGVLYGYQSFPVEGRPNGSTDRWNPALYVGTDGRLHGAMWSGDTADSTVSPAPVNDGTWHHAALVGDLTGQTLYLDGVKAADNATGRPITYNGSAYAYLGAGTVDSWPERPADSAGHFEGTLADFAIYNYALTAGSIAAHRRTGTRTGTNNGIDAAGAYRANIVQDGAYGYWRLNDPAGSRYANAELGTALPNTTAGTYQDVTLNANGPTDDYDNQRSAVFNGSTSYVQLPPDAAPARGPATMELWFRTTSGGPLYGYQDWPVDTARPDYAQWNDALYVGSDGRLHGQFWMGSADYTLTSDRTVNDGTWHQAVLAADDSGQTLYLDGRPTATDNGGHRITFNGARFAYLGAAETRFWPATAGTHFNGSIAEASFYPSRLDADTVAAHFRSMGNGGGATPVTTARVTDPTGNILTYRYDVRSGKKISTTDAYGNNTRYSYDTGGFPHTVTDPNGHTRTTGHDARGNEVSRTTCQDATHCQTSYAQYYLDATADHLGAANDTMTGQSDARSNGAGDTAYRTSYSHGANGELNEITTPATPDFPQGRSSYLSRTSGTEGAVGSDGGPEAGTQPPGLLTQQTPYVDRATHPDAASVPAGQSTRRSYNAAGDLTKTVTPLGLTTTYTYNNLGRLTSSTETCADCGPGATPTTSTTTYTWDGQGNPTGLTEPATTDAVTGTVHTARTTIVYDQDGNPTSRATSDLTGGDKPRTTTWTYAPNLSRVAKTTDPAGRSNSYAYDQYGNTVSMTDAAGTKYRYSYSPMGHLQQTAVENYTGNPNNPVAPRWQVLEARAYDPAGRLASVTDAMGRTVHTYYYDDDTVAEVGLDAFHTFAPATQAFDGGVRNVVLERNTYDAAGHLTQRVTGGGRTTAVNTWDAAGRATSTVLDPGGLNRTSGKAYDAVGNVLRATVADANGSRETDFTYDNGGNITSRTVKNAPQDSTTTFTYDQRGLPLSTTSPNGNVNGAVPAAHTTTFVHDAAGRQVSATAPPVATTTLDPVTGQPITLTAAPQTRTGYDTFGETTSTRDATGNVTTVTHSFDAAGEHLAVAGNTYTAPDGSGAFTAVTRTDYDVMGRPKVLTDAVGGVTTHVYDQLGNLVERDLPTVGGVTPKWLYTYDLNGETLSTSDPTGAVELSTYDDLGRPVTLSKLVRQTSHAAAPAGSPPVTPAVYTGSFGYDDAGNRTTIVTPNRETSTVAYNAADERIRTTDPLGNTTTTSYDLVGAAVRTTLPADSSGGTGRSLTTTYDRAGRPIGTANLDESGAVVSSGSIEYDAEGNPVAATDADGNTSRTEYDVLGRVVRQIQPVDATHNITTASGYDAAGHRTRYTDGNGQSTYVTYNSLGLAESTVEPATSAYPNLADRTYTTVYDPNLRPVTALKPGGVKTRNTYDGLGRLTAQSGTGGEAPAPARDLGYDLAGRITSVSTPGGRQSFAYEDRGLLWSSSGPQGEASYSYNSDGLLTSRTDATGTAAFGYDAAGRVTTFADPLTGQAVGYSYYPSGAVRSIGYGTGTTRSFTYDGKQNVLSDTLTTAGTTKASLTYSYYASGRLKSQSTTGLAGTGSAGYTYDRAGRLTGWNKATGTTSYGYDDNGNLTSSGATTAAYNQRNQLVTAGATTYTFTARGTRSSVTGGGSTTTTGYNAFDELVAEGGRTYAYDGLGRLSSTAGRSFGYAGTSTRIVSDGTDAYSRTPDGGLVALGSGGGGVFAYSNRHGDLVGTFTANGTSMASSAAYDPWGKPDGSSGAGNRIGYQGGWTDPASGRVNTASRWYDPGTAEFTSRDEAPLSTTTAAAANLYAYAEGDPVNAADTSGHRSCSPLPVPVPRSGGPSGGDDGDSPPPARSTPPPPAAAPAPAPAPSPYGLAARQEFDLQRMLEKDRLDSVLHPYSGGWQPYYGNSWVTGGGISILSGWGGWSALSGLSVDFSFFGGLALNPFGRNSCDTPTRRHNDPVTPKKTTPTAAPPKPVDPHTIAPKPCTSCTSPTPGSTPLNGPELGQTQSGEAEAVHSGPGSPFNPGSLQDPLTGGSSAFQPGPGQQNVPAGASQADWDGLVQRCQYWYGKSEGDCRKLPVMVVDGKRTPRIAVNDQSAIDAGHPFLLNALRNQAEADRNRELAGCKSAWEGPQSCDEYPFASTFQGGVGAQTLGVPVWEQRIQGPDISGFYARNRIKRGDEFLVLVVNVKRYGGVYYAG